MSSGGAPEIVPASGGPSAGSDAELATRIARGDARALEELYDRYATAVYGLIARLVPNPHDREEILQDAFLTVWRRAATYDGRRGRLSSWLMAIAHHRAIDFLRRHRRNGTLEPLPAEWPARADEPLDLSPQDSVTQQVQALHEREAIARALRALRPEEQQVVILAYFHGYTHKEIASRFAIPLGTVKSRLRSAVERLRDLMAAQTPDPGSPVGGKELEG